MSPIKYLLVAIALFAWTFSVHSEIIPDQAKIVAVPDYSIIMAAFPYFPRSVRKGVKS